MKSHEKSKELLLLLFPRTIIGLQKIAPKCLIFCSGVHLIKVRTVVSSAQIVQGDRLLAASKKPCASFDFDTFEGILCDVF